MSVTITVHGDRQLMRMFQNLDKRTAGKVIRKSLRNGAKKMQQRAKARAPKDTGELKKAIRVRAMKRSRQRIGVRVIVDPARIDDTGDDHPKRVSGAFQEYGTQHSAAHPFLRPAFDSLHRQVFKDVVTEMKSLIAEEARRAR